MQISLGGRLGRSSLESRRPPQSAEPYLHLSINLSQYYTVTHVKLWYNYKSFCSSHFRVFAIFAISAFFTFRSKLFWTNFINSLNSNPEMAVLQPSPWSQFSAHAGTAAQQPPYLPIVMTPIIDSLGALANYNIANYRPLLYCQLPYCQQASPPDQLPRVL